jgi:DNA anti-recombination protein RmuC
MGAKATDALPDIRKNLEGLISDMRTGAAHYNKAANDAITQVNDHHTKQVEAAQKVTSAYQNLAATTQQQNDAQLTAITKALEGLNAGVKTTIEGMQKDITNLVQSSGNQITDLSRRNEAAIEKNIQDLDKALGEELTKSLESLGNNLATLSNKFVQDYSPLTDRLREIVRIAKGA